MLSSFHSFLIIVLLLLWLVPLIMAWVRYDSLRHAKTILIAVLVWPLMLVDEAVKTFDAWSSLLFVAGLFQFVPALMAYLMFRSVHTLVIKKPFDNQTSWLAPIGLILLLQVPFLLVPADTKLTLLISSPVGDPVQNWPMYSVSIACGFVLLVAGLKSVDMLQRYQHYLSDQVVDVHLYKLPMLTGWFAVQVCIAFAIIIFTVLVALGLLPFSSWQSSFTLSLSAFYLVMLVLLLQRRRYSPSSLNYDQLAEPKFSSALLQDTLLKAEHAVIHYKAYKRIGLRIDQLATAADVDPTALAVATRTILNRNFRAFIYHYRLEYAKKVLMQTDAKVSSVAKRLGFNSEKFLSNMFIKYIQQMSTEPLATDDSDLDPFSAAPQRMAPKG